MSPDMTRHIRTRWSFPRVSGDEPAGARFTITDPKFSPRERG